MRSHLGINLDRIGGCLIDRRFLIQSLWGYGMVALLIDPLILIFLPPEYHADPLSSRN
jgi:hypothetical protein